METFKGMVANCQKMKENGTEACTCWSNSNFTSLAATIRFEFNYMFFGKDPDIANKYDDQEVQDQQGPGGGH